ncbi:MAG TPA: CRISPR-associated endonuclease Cas1 [Methanotrichaceae archaeon]|nr:CRISPR-associated endonuclease Cas1 [Methanotrichaceae archaeon]HQJ28064.1 CRISPR-associated endonuclease Cas1 [Methanotrichaceae archaeon]
MSRIILSDRGTFLGKSGEQFRVTRKDEPEVQIPARKVEQILVLGSGISVSSDAVQMADQLGVEIVFANYFGKPLARLIPASLGGTVKTRREQYYAYGDCRGSDLAKSFVRGKLKNQASLLKSFAKKWKGERQDLWQVFRENSGQIEALIPRIDQISGNLDDCRERIMGVEGTGAEIYWRTWGLLIPEEWKFPGRDYPDARDPINSLLNFGYYVLEQEVWAAALYAGLDPYAGFLHADRSGKEKLVYDLMEEFRPLVVDRVVVSLAREMKVGHFQEDFRMTKDGIKIASSAFYSRLDERIAYREQSHQLRNIIRSQAATLSTFLRGERHCYQPFTPRW